MQGARKRTVPEVTEEKICGDLGCCFFISLIFWKIAAFYGHDFLS
jgi:hypothetical protein